MVGSLCSLVGWCGAWAMAQRPSCAGNGRDNGRDRGMTRWAMPAHIEGKAAHGVHEAVGIEMTAMATI